MNRSIKAALLSALLFPGAGHFFLRKYLSGTVLAGMAFTGIYLLVAQVVESALQISQKIQMGEIQPDVARLTELVEKQPAGTDAQLLNFATAILLISWLAGIFDSYRIGRVQEKAFDADT